MREGIKYMVRFKEDIIIMRTGYVNIIAQG